MRFTIVILSALLCLNATAESNIDGRSDEALIAAAEQLIAESEAKKAAEKEAEAVVVKAVAAKPEELKESEIPVILGTKKVEKAESNLIWRLIASFGVLILVAGALVYASKRWARKKDKGGERARIEIMHQYHLGPRRSLALVRVSGETMLIGITDQNISMLKPVTLIDDELEHVMNKDFNGFLDDEFSIEDVRNAINPRA